MTVDFRFAEAGDVQALQALIESGYRGDAARAGWTHEADYIEGERITVEELSAMIAAPYQRFILATDGTALVGCVALTDLDDSRAYLGLLCVSPACQAGGLGRTLLARAEACARKILGASIMEMTVVSLRTELVAYYQRRGHGPTGERRPFPVPGLGLELVVMEKGLTP